MSSSKLFILNCGASHVSGSLFTKAGNGALTLDEFISQDLEFDYSDEEGWQVAVVSAIRAIMSTRRFPSEATLIVPGYQILTKPIRVPVVDSSRQAQTIAFEVQNQLPYSLSEVVWDQHLIEDDGVEQEVMVLAVKSSVVNSLCEQVDQLGLKVNRVSGATVLDYNAYQLNESSAEDTLLINIGAKSTNLTFISDDRLFVRNINLAGNSLTQSLADGLGKPFPKAEALKIKFFSGETKIDRDDPASQILTTSADAFMKRLSTEVTRSIAGYRRSHDGKAPSRILLTGRGSLLNGLSDYLAEKLKLPVTYFKPTLNITLGKKVDVGSDTIESYQLSEVVGQAYAEMLDEGVDINLLPQHIEAAQEFSRKKPLIVVGVACLAVATVLPWLGFQQKASAIEAQIQEAQQKTTPIAALSTQIADTRIQAENVRADIELIEGLVTSKSNWINFFVDLQDRMQQVEDVFLDELKVERTTVTATQSTSAVDPVTGERLPAPTPQQTYRLLMKGRIIDFENPQSRVSSATNNRVNQFLSLLRGSEFTQEITGQRFDPSQEGVLKFEFTVVINPQKPL